MAESFSKKELEKRKAKEKKDKAEKMKERKANSGKKSLDDMMAYLDENGNITSTPPDPKRMNVEINLEDIQLGAAKVVHEEATVNTGTVSFFNEAKGYGFITDNKTRENIFVHANNLQQPVKERDKVTYDTERTPRGMAAINVKKII